MKMTSHGMFLAIVVLCQCLGTSTPTLSQEKADSKPWDDRTHALGQAGDMPEGRHSVDELRHLRDIGEALFKAKFTELDGAGRPDATQAILPTKRRHPQIQPLFRTAGPDATSCASCHNEPLIGGAGDFVTNVFASEGFESADFDSLDPQFSNERGTNHLFGAGLIELLAREMSVELQTIRQMALDAAHTQNRPVTMALSTKGVEFGSITAAADGTVDLSALDGLDTDLVIRPFSQKGVMTSLRQFTVNALNHHHGMQADERFGARWTGTDDFDGDGYLREVTAADVSALVAWQATLKVPGIAEPSQKEWQQAAKSGEQKFEEFGCQSCHRPSLPLDGLLFSDPGPFDVSGTLNIAQVQRPALYDFAQLEWVKNLPRDEKGRVLVPLFGDLKRHDMVDNQVDGFGNELLSQRFVNRNAFMTAELWGVGSTAPYGHRNDMTTLDRVIREHGGSGRAARDRYVAATDAERSALVAFLKTLVIAE